jgi:predicted CXXCH cytochrome family protein
MPEATRPQTSPTDVLTRLNRQRPAWPGRILAAAAGTALLLLAATACRSVNRAAVLLPDVPGTKYIGAKECEQCHDEICKTFATADHSRLIAQGPNALAAGCESCHGPCSVHSESGGETLPPYSFTSGRPQASSLGARLAVPPRRAQENVCFTCHADIRGQFNLPSHHPLPEGRMRCSECHPPHKGRAQAFGSASLRPGEEGCIQCHPAQSGPFVFEHEALREGCTACHAAHGAINAKLLTVRGSNLCLKCHFQQIQAGAVMIGGVDHSARLQVGTCWTAGCHEAVHGSRVNSSLRF